jgi:hypothetical protein
MPGWYVHLSAAKIAAEVLPRVSGSIEPNNETGFNVRTFVGGGPTPIELATIIQKYPNYYALGAIGPDIFFLLPDFKGGVGNFIARMAEWVTELYDYLDENVFKPWEDMVGPIEEDTTEEISRLTGGLSDEISRIATYASGIITNAVLGFASRLYDWFSLFGSGVAPGYDDKLFFWSDMFHYRRTNEFARDLFERAQKFAFDDESTQGDLFKYEPGVAFALGWMTHIGTDVTGHALVNEKSGGPYRLHWQRHHLVENHMDAFVYSDQNGSRERYNMVPISALHFWLQFNPDNMNEPDYSYFEAFNSSDPKHFPDYPTGLRARDYYDRNKAFDVDSKLPTGLANFILDTMKVTFYDRHNSENNDGMETHPMILEAIKPSEKGRPDTDLLNTTYELLYRYVKYTTTDYYKMPKPQPPDVFPNLDPPIPPGSNDDAPGDSESDWSFWDWLLAIFSWIAYIGEWIAYLVSILPAIILDLFTYPARYVLYLFEEALYEMWKAFRFLLVMEGFVMPEPDEIDLGLVQLGLPSKGPYQGLLGIMNDVFGGLLGDDPNPVPPSEPVHDGDYPRQTVKDEPSFLGRFIETVSDLFQTRCGLSAPSDPRQPSEFLRPWEYPLQNNEHHDIDMELSHTIASPHNAGTLPTVFFGQMPGNDEARKEYEGAQTPDATDKINMEKLTEKWNMGDPIFYSLYVMGQLTRDKVEPANVPSFNLDSDRGYGYKCWDWDRHDKFTARYNGDSSFAYRVPCTPPEQFNKNDICGTDTPHDIQLEYNPRLPLLIHYLAMLKKGQRYPGCSDKQNSPVG